MKKLVLSLAAFMLVGSVAIAQNKNVNKAQRLYDNGEIAEALPLIQEAIEHEKTAEKGKTWYLYGQILQAIFSADEDSELTSMVDSPLKMAADAYNKVLTLEKEGNTYYGFSQMKIQELYGVALNEGVQKFQEQDYEGAIEGFNNALIVEPTDTTANLYAGIAAQQSEQNKLALTYYYRLFELDNYNPEIINSVLAIERYENKDNAKALEVVRMAMEKHPDNKDFPKIEIQLLIDMDIVDEATKKLEEEIERDPENAALHYSLGYLNEQLGNTEEKVKAYEKALELDPDYLEPNFNLGVHYFNVAVEFTKEYNNMDLQTSRKKGKAVLDKAEENWKKALPYFEKCKEIAPEEIAVLESLRTIYGRLRMIEKAEEVDAEIERLGGNN